MRQLGAAFELASVYLRWLGNRELDPSVVAFDAISMTCKSLILKGARAVTSSKPVALAPLLGELATQWETGMSRVAKRYGA